MSLRQGEGVESPPLPARENCGRKKIEAEKHVGKQVLTLSLPVEARRLPLLPRGFLGSWRGRTGPSVSWSPHEITEADGVGWEG